MQHLQSRKQDLEDHKLDTLQSFKEWCLGLSSKKAYLVAAYEKEDENVDILSEAKDEDSILCYEIRYSTACMPERHMEIFIALGYQPEYAAIRPDMTPAYPWDLHMLEVRWKPCMKLATTVENQPESAALPANHMLRGDWMKAAHALDPQRLDLDLTVLQQKGHEPRLGQPVMPWAPELAAKFISTH